ncbi:unnamed protein product, partial [Effrenium voratum]
VGCSAHVLQTLPAMGAPGLSMFSALCLALARPLLAEVRLPPVGAELREAPVLRSEAGVANVSLRLRPANVVGSDMSFSTRLYNEMIPGPTIIVQPGDRLLVNVINDLEVPAGKAANNSYQLPNTTNLHVHGLHVSPSAPADEVFFTVVGPKQSNVYDYQIPADHSPGTYWAHPHHHGSTVMQSGAGAASPLLVADPPGFLSEQLASMPDHVLMLQNIPLPLLDTAAKASEDQLFHASSTTDLWLVNGGQQPTLTVKPNKWHRLRLVMAGVANWLYLSFGRCEVALLAKDGIYIEDFPRWIQRVSLPPGGRAEVVARCPKSNEDEDLEQVLSSAASAGVRSYVGPLFSFRVAGVAENGRDLEPWKPRTRPSYLQDLRGELTQPDCSCKTAMGLGAGTRSIDGHIFQGAKAYLHQWPRDAVAERHLSGLNKHSFHQHTWPFQLQETPAGNDPFFKAGDWHDTYQNVLDAEARVRFSTLDFSGAEVVHCHALAHSDQGMIGAEVVAGRGPAACHCDLLGEAKETDLLADQTSLSILTAAGLLCLSMVVLAALIAGQVVRQARRLEGSYAALAEGP